MFNSYEFSFAGESSLMYGMMIYDLGRNGQGDVAFGNKATIVQQRIGNRIQPIHFGVRYNDEPLQFKLVFGSERALDRYELEDVGFWLTGHQDYQWLSIDQPDMELYRFRCLITELTPLSHGWLPVAFEATVVCDCPYAYGFEFEKRYQINGGADILFRNESSVREFIKPDILFEPAVGVSALSIVNHSDGGRRFLIEGIPKTDGIQILIDNRNGIITEKTYGYNLYGGFNLNFFRLVHGDNLLSVTGNGTLVISGRFLYNVAG